MALFSCDDELVLSPITLPEDSGVGTCPLLRSHILVKYVNKNTGEEEEVIDYNGENWWVCVFRPEKQLPPVTYGTEVTQTTSFVGIDMEEDDIWRWLADFALSLNLGTGKQARSIPPLPEELWAAFYKTWKNVNTEYREGHGLFLGDSTTNEFELFFSEDTRQE